MLDPLAEKVHSVNPYAYTDNNPVNNIDPNGMETYYGEEARAVFSQLQNQTKSHQDNDKDDPPKKSERPGYFRAFYDKSKKLDPFGNAGRTWRGWLSSDSNLGGDIWNAVSNTYWGIASLTSTDTYVNWLEGQKQYWSSSGEERGKIDAQAISNLIEGGVTYAPLGEAASVTGKFLTFNANAGYGVEIGNLSLMYQNPKVGGGTIIAYNSSKIRLRLDYHRIPKEVSGMSLHYHTNFGGRSLSKHRSLNPLTFGQPIKAKR